MVFLFLKTGDLFLKTGDLFLKTGDLIRPNQPA
jgi:hypothetical protein